MYRLHAQSPYQFRRSVVMGEIHTRVCDQSLMNGLENHSSCNLDMIQNCGKYKIQLDLLTISLICQVSS